MLKKHVKILANVICKNSVLIRVFTDRTSTNQNAEFICSADVNNYNDY